MTDQATQMDSCAAMSEPVEAHRKLEPFVGTFKAEVTIWMGPGEPMVSTGTMTNTWELGGRFLHQSYAGDPDDGPFPDFQGRGYWGYNTGTNQYEGFWIDSAGTMMQHDAGSVDAGGNVWTMTGSMYNPQVNGQMTKKSVITLRDRDHHSMEMFMTGPDGKECKVMEIQYTRA